MITLTVCPSRLAEGFDTYSPAARKKCLTINGISLFESAKPFDQQ